MADGKELKPKSFRIDEATAERFKEISAQIGGNQQETLSKLIEAYEFQSGKAILTDKKADIEQFERYVTALTRMYMESLEDNQNITETVRTEYDALMKSKDVTIQDLQGKLAEYKQVADTATAQAKEAAGQNTELKAQIEELTERYNSKAADMQAMLSDKDNLNKALTDSCNDLKAKIDSMEQSVNLSKSLQEKLETAEKERDRLEKQQADHEKEIAGLKGQLQLANEKAMLEREKDFQKQLQQIKAEHQTEIDKYQKMYLELLEQIRKGDEK